MPSRVEFRLGSIFDQTADLLVIPSSTWGTVTQETQEEIRRLGLPSPEAMPWGTLCVFSLDKKPWSAIAYAAVSDQTLSEEVVEKIGQQLGRESETHRFETIVAPLLDAGSADWAPSVSAAALLRGFEQTAPAHARLIIIVRDYAVFAPLFKGTAFLVAGGLKKLKKWFSAPGAGVQTALGQVAGTTRQSSRPLGEAAQISNVSEPPPGPTQPQTPAPSQSFVTAAAPASRRNGVFISYSHADRGWLERLQKHLKPLQREGIEVWADTRLKAGEQWRDEIREALSNTRVAILLISADFLASDFIVTNELPPLLTAAEEDGATILPVIISACGYVRMESLSRFQAVNDPAKPLVDMRRGNREKVLDQVARAVEDALKR